MAKWIFARTEPSYKNTISPRSHAQKHPCDVYLCPYCFKERWVPSDTVPVYNRCWGCGKQIEEVYAEVIGG